MSAATTTSPLDAAREHLRQLCGAADGLGDWRTARLLDPLHDVADMVCRVGEHFGDSAHYEADKSGDMVLAAVRVRREAFYRYVGFYDQPDETSDPIGDLSSTVDDLEQAVEGVLWALARNLIEQRADGAIPADMAGAALDHLFTLTRLVQAIPTYTEDDE